MDRLTLPETEDAYAYPKGYEKFVDEEIYIGHCGIVCLKQNNCRTCPLQKCITKLSELEDAEEQGRLIELPLSYGDHIFEVYESGHKVIEWTVEGFSIKPDSTYICIGHGVSINAAKLGKDLFHTREEAEAKLKEMEDDHDNTTSD